MPYFKNKKIVCVEWEDACRHNGYYEPAQDADYSTIHCRTVGFLVKRTRKEVKICEDYFEDGRMRDVHSIPKGMVHKVIVLKDVH